MTQVLPLNSSAFAPFGDVISAGDAPRVINGGMCERHHDLASLDVEDGAVGISLFHGKQRSWPVKLEYFERHPLGSQAFLPLNNVPMLVIVAPDMGGVPGKPQVFLSDPGQGINIGRNVWHGVLTPIGGDGVYAVVDYVGPRENLIEHYLAESVEVQPPSW